jgi:hypothetical protein
MDPTAVQRHLANVEQHITKGRASVLRQHEISGRFERTGGGRSETAGIARAFLHQMERRLEMYIADRDWLQDQLHKAPLQGPSLYMLGRDPSPIRQKSIRRMLSSELPVMTDQVGT